MTHPPHLALLAALALSLPAAASEPAPSSPPLAPATPAGPPTFQESWLAPIDALYEQLEDASGDRPDTPPAFHRDAPPIAGARSLPADADLLSRAKLQSGRLVVREGGVERELTIDPALQRELSDVLRSYETPWGAVVVLEPSTGRVLAMAEHSQVAPSLRGLTTAAIFPAASVFKIVTAAALLAEGIGPETTECFHGGKRRITEKHLVDSDRDSRCQSMADALAMSANAVFAKLTLKHLTPQKLAAWADAFQFNRRIPFPIPTDISPAVIPEGDEVAFASAGAGFGDVFMSPLHGAALASVAANRGLWRDPILFEDQVSALAPGLRVMTPEEASQLADMMQGTVDFGTARRIFRQRGFRVPGAVGKTGSLADKKPFRDYSWFVGYAPREDPQVAVAAIVVNDYYWRIRATWLAREAMRLALQREAAALAPSVTQGRRGGGR